MGCLRRIWWFSLSVVTYEAGVRSAPVSSEAVSFVPGRLCVVCSLGVSQT